MPYTKTSWDEATAITPARLNQLETQAETVEGDTRTPNQAAAPAPSGTLASILSYFATRIKSITGRANWYDAPDITLASLNAHTSRHVPGGDDALPTAAPSGGLGTSNVVGVSTSFARADHGHLAFDTTAPVAEAIGSTVSVGAASTAARRDHRHAMPGAADLLTAIKTVDGAGSGLDADTVDGYAASAGTPANSIPVRDSAGQIPMPNGYPIVDAAAYTKILSGTTVATTDSSGNAVINIGYASAYNIVVLSVINGDTAASGGAVIIGGIVGAATNNFTVNTNHIGGGIRLNWMARVDWNHG